MPNTTATANRIGLTNKQTTAMIIIGFTLWALAAVILRMILPMGALEGANRAITYAVVIPATAPFVLITKTVAKLRSDQIFTGMAIVTATALLIDGIVIAWFPAIYGDNLTDVIKCAAAILWGAGVGLALACIFNTREAV
jgi:hypothetical protein